MNHPVALPHAPGKLLLLEIHHPDDIRHRLESPRAAAETPPRPPTPPSRPGKSRASADHIVKAGDTVPVLAKEYGADEEAVWDAIRCELALEAA